MEMQIPVAILSKISLLREDWSIFCLSDRELLRMKHWAGKVTFEVNPHLVQSRKFQDST